MTKHETQVILFFILVVSAGLLFLSLARFSFYQNYIQNTDKNKNISKSGINNSALLTDNEEREKNIIRAVDINSADLKTLMQLPGIGRETALNIIEYRSNIGEFTEVNALLHVKGIGIKKLEKIQEYIIIKY